MDLSPAKTFLEIVASGNFIRAAERLHVTQTAVSARVRTLEGLLGSKLFVRNKAGASLTTAGKRFLRYAQTLVQVWERARHQVLVPPGKRALVTVGCEVSLWDPLLLDWLLWMRQAAPQLAIRTEVGARLGHADASLHAVNELMEFITQVAEIVPGARFLAAASATSRRWTCPLAPSAPSRSSSCTNSPRHRAN